jgi:two-component system, chemotaxis family, protein-glutamate methylesterase/glutaminase
LIRVLIVDDSATLRTLLSSLLSEDPAIEVAGTAANGKLALSQYQHLRPDVVLMDIVMPEMDGMDALRALRQSDPRAVVIMLSVLTRRGATVTLDALGAGDVDYVAKPESAEAIPALRADLIAKIKLHAGLRRAAESLPALLPRVSSRTKPSRAPQRPGIVAIASSTGGPNALAVLIAALPRELRVPVVVAQHMPEVFTKLLAERLNVNSRVRVLEGVAGDTLQAGVVYLAPGGHHMETAREGGQIRLRLHDGPLENGCRPAADVLFRSVAACYGGAVVAVVLTGMGHDGLRGCQALHQAGAQVIVQDEASSVIWGMPRVVAEAHLADAILPLTALGPEIVRRVGP